MRIRSGDLVMVTAGNQAGKKGKVLRVDREAGQVVVEGLNLRWKYLRKSQKNPQGGRVNREVPFAIANVMPFCSKCDRGVRIRREGQGGKDKRVCAKCGQAVGTG